MKYQTIIALLLFIFWETTMACSDVLEHEIKPLNKNDPIKLCDYYENKVIMVVNTASKCGFTYQYEGLETLYDLYKNQEFVVLGFPSNDFLWQEPGTEEEIAKFCKLNYGVSFPMFEKIHVKKKNAHPIFQALAKETGKYPSWNFNKYVINREGKVVKHFGSRVKPSDPKVVSLIETLL